MVCEHSIHRCDEYYALILNNREASHNILKINGLSGFVVRLGQPYVNLQPRLLTTDALYTEIPQIIVQLILSVTPIASPLISRSTMRTRPRSPWNMSWQEVLVLLTTFPSQCRVAFVVITFSYPTLSVRVTSSGGSLADCRLWLFLSYRSPTHSFAIAHLHRFWTHAESDRMMKNVSTQIGLQTKKCSHCLPWWSLDNAGIYSELLGRETLDHGCLEIRTIKL